MGLLTVMPGAGALPLAWSPSADPNAADAYYGIATPGSVDAGTQFPLACLQFNPCSPDPIPSICLDNEPPYRIRLTVLAPTSDVLALRNRWPNGAAFEEAEATWGHPAELVSERHPSCPPVEFTVIGHQASFAVPYVVDAYEL